MRGEKDVDDRLADLKLGERVCGVARGRRRIGRRGSAGWSCAREGWDREEGMGARRQERYTMRAAKG